MGQIKHNRGFPSQQPTRKAWQGMMNRCYTVTNKDYPTVGGRGLTVCDEWHSYEAFKRDMGEKPDSALLARYCEGLGFTKENTYWQQKVNTRSNRLYGIWKGIRRRCGVIGKADLGRAIAYGARGIEMSSDWENDFIKFATDVGQPPSELHTIDRIDNDLGYFPGNVRWATPKEQANNRSDNIIIEMQGERKTLQEWCEHFGVDRRVVDSRWRNLFKLTNLKNQACAQYNMNGELVQRHSGVREAAASTGIKQGTISKCLSGGNASAGGYIWRYES